MQNDGTTKHLIEWQKQRRDAILSELAFIEKQLIEAGEMSGPTTGELRKMYRNGVLVIVK